MPLHVSAEQGYAAVGATYEKGRPEYPSDAVAYLMQRLGVACSGDTKRVIDLAAGTGKFTRALLNAGITPVAVEPVAHMRDTLHERTPNIDIYSGSAESMSFEDHTADAVVAAQAFHWFDGRAALTEIHRVLTPLGGLGLVWNGQDLSIDWVGAIWKEVNARRGDTPHAWSYDWKDAFAHTTAFSPLISATFLNHHETDRDRLIARVMSISFIAAGSQDDRDELTAHIRRVCDDAQLPEQFVLPYNCFVHWCRAV